MNKEQIYDTQINPLMAKIIEICTEHTIPYIASFQLTTKEEDIDGALFCTSGLFPDGSDEGLLQARHALYNTNTVTALTITRQSNTPESEAMLHE